MNPQSWNAYAYVLGNPLNATDPTGSCPMYSYSSADKNGIVTFHDDVGPCPWEQPWLQISNFACVYFGICRTPGQSQSSGGSAANSGGRAANQQTATNPAKTGNCSSRWVPHGGGITYGGNGDLGILATGVTATGSAGFGVFHDSNTGTSAGAFATGGAAAYFLNHAAGAPKQIAQPLSLGGMPALARASSSLMHILCSRLGVHSRRSQLMSVLARSPALYSFLGGASGRCQSRLPSHM